MGARRPGRERRRGRRRRRHRRGHPHREPQPPVGHRALPGRGHRGRRDPPRHLHDGRPPDRPDGPAALRSARRPPQPLDRRGRRVRHLGLRQLGRRARPSAARSCSTRPTRATRSSTCCASACCPTDRLVLGQATGVGNLAVLLGSSHRPRRHRRGQRAGLGRLRRRRADADKRPSVQVGDPFEEKRLIEACLALLDAGLVVGIQDLGGAGLDAARPARPRRRAGVGMDVDVTRRAPSRAGHGAVRGDDVSESQERMLAIVEPEDLDEVLAHLRSGGRCGPTVVGTVTDGRRRLRDPRRRGTARSWPTCPASSLHEAAPLYDRPMAGPRPRPATPSRRRSPRPADCGADLLGLLADTSWVWSPVRPPAVPQHRRGPGRRRHRAAPQAPDHRASTPVGAWPSPPTATTAGARSTPAQGTAHGRGRVGAQPGLRRGPAAGARELPQLRQPRAPRGDVAAVRGRSTAWPRPAGPSACPVVGGNVSLYNESEGADIDPTPGRRRARPGRRARAPPAGRRPGRRAAGSCCVGPEHGGLAGSAVGSSHRAQPAGRPAPARPAAALGGGRRSCGRWSSTGSSTACTTWPTAASALCLAEMAVASGVGFTVAGVADHRGLFAEAPSRVVVCVAPTGRRTSLARADAAGVPARGLGSAGGDRLVVKGLVDVAPRRGHRHLARPPPRCPGRRRPLTGRASLGSPL